MSENKASTNTEFDIDLDENLNQSILTTGFNHSDAEEEDEEVDTTSSDSINPLQTTLQPPNPDQPKSTQNSENEPQDEASSSAESQNELQITEEVPRRLPNRRRRREFKFKAFFVYERSFEDFNSFAVALITLDTFYLTTQTLFSVLGWLLTDSINMAFVSLTNFMFYVVIWVMFGLILYSIYHPNVLAGSLFRLVLIRLLLVWFWVLLEIVAVGCAFFEWGFGTRGGWGGRGQYNGPGKPKFQEKLFDCFNFF